MTNEKEILIGLLTKTFGMAEDAIQPILYKEGTEEIAETAFDTLLKLDAERVSKLKPNTKAIEKAASEKALNDFFTQIKGNYQIPSDKTGLELLDEVLAAKATTPAKGETTEETVKKSKWFLDAVEAKNNEINTVKSEYETKLTEFQNQMQREQIFGKVKDKAVMLFDGWNPVLPQDAAKAANQKQRLFVDELAKTNFRFEDGKDPIPLDADGNDLTDQHGHRIGFEPYIRQIADANFEFAVAKARSSAGNDGSGGAAPNKNYSALKTDEDFQRAFVAAQGKPEEMKEVYTAHKTWREQSGPPN